MPEPKVPAPSQSDFSDEFLEGGTILSKSGTSNVLIVAPNRSPDTEEGKNIARLTSLLVGSLTGYGVLNGKLYRKPLESDPSPEDLDIPPSRGPDKQKKAVLKLREKLLNETGGIPADLRFYDSAATVAHEYVESVWLAAGEIGRHATPLVFFIDGMDGATADANKVDVAVGAGYLHKDRDTAYAKDETTANREFMEELIQRLRSVRPQLRIKEGIEGCSHEIGGEVPRWLAYSWNEFYDPEEDDEFRAEYVNCVQLTFRYRGLRDTVENLYEIAEGLTEVIRGLSLFTSWDQAEQLKVDEGTYTISKALEEVVEMAPIGQTETPAAIQKEVVDKTKTQDTADQECLGWMVPNTISRRKNGTCNVLVVVPHGFEGDDDHAEILGAYLAAALGSYAVINNQKYKRPRDEDGNFTEDADLSQSVVDLNIPDHAEMVAEDYLVPIRQACDEMLKIHLQTPLVFFVHGLGDPSADTLPGEKPDIILGKGFTRKYSGSKASASEPFLKDLFRKLKQQEMGVVRDDVSDYSGRTKMPPRLRKDYKARVEAAQIEIRWTGYRDNDENLKKAALNFAEVVCSLEAFRSRENVRAVPVDFIKAEDRFRKKSADDVEDLCASIQRVGLLHPVVLTPSLKLIAGERRLNAFKKLGKTEIPAHVVGLGSNAAVEAEHDENVVRKPFLPSEVVAIQRALWPELQEEATLKRSEGGKKGGRGRKSGETFSQPKKKRDKLFEITRVSRVSRKKAEKVVEAAETEPETFAHLLEEMDRTGKIDRAYRALMKAGYVSKGAEGESENKFNRTNENIEWAKWTWNPVTGCKHGCAYCYAREAANRFYTQFPADQRFEPRFWEKRLQAPSHTKIPKGKQAEPGWKNVFVCSMADLFGKWVEEDWIKQVLRACQDNPQWTYIFLTKNPSRLPKITFPENCWVGTTVDRQKRVKPALKAMAQVKATVRFISCEPLLEDLTFPTLEPIGWIILGAQRKTVQREGIQPKWEWLRHLEQQARDAKTPLYLKPNLNWQEIRPREYPPEK